MGTGVYIDGGDGFRVQLCAGGQGCFLALCFKGEWEIEGKTEYLIDSDNNVDGSWEQSLEVGYGLTDFMSVEVGVEFEDEPGEDTKTSGVEFEAKFQFTDKGEYFVDSGAKVEYKHDTATGADKIGAKIIFAKSFEEFSHKANFKIEREIGDNSADHEEYDFSWATKYSLSDDLALGGEYYADFADLTEDYDGQKHRLGPVVYGEFAGLEYEAGVLAGISRAAPDATVKINLGYEF